MSDFNCLTWNTPPDNIFLEKVTTSASTSKCSWAHMRPEPPAPVCTSSIRREMSRCLHTRASPWKKYALPWLSPPSDWMGSVMIPATGWPSTV